MYNQYKKPTKDELKKMLTNEQYNCTQEEGTEPPFQNAYWNHLEVGIYVDVVSGEPLFSSLDKFDSGTGWPSFTRPILEKSIVTKTDFKIGLPRTELRSHLADSHLGHVFDDGPAPTHQRFCINSLALKFVPLNELKEKGYGEFLFQFAHIKNWEIAIVAGGCFWGVEELFRKQIGVLETQVGYIGGDTNTANYNQVKLGDTGHAESVRILFDPQITNYENILYYFFKIHDPTTVNQQGNDKGSQYRSEIFYLNDFQKEVANKVIERVNNSKKWGAPVVTKITCALPFSPAENYHQKYLAQHPDGYTCHFPRNIDF